MEDVVLSPEIRQALDELNCISVRLNSVIKEMDALAYSKIFPCPLFDEAYEFTDRAEECLEICRSVYGQIVEAAVSDKVSDPADSW